MKLFKTEEWVQKLKPMAICALATASGLSVFCTIMPARAQELTTGTDTNYFQVYGQFNKGFLYYDDDQRSKWYPLVDNGSSGTRFGIRTHNLSENGVAVGTNVEFQWTPYSTGYVNLTNAHDVNFADVGLRKAEVYISHDNIGKIWVGHGSMAADGTSEVDLSGTSLAGYASVGDIAGGQLFRISDGSLSDVAIHDAYIDSDGLGRENRVRYDTPEINGFTLGTSLDIDWSWDVSLKYQGEVGDYSLGAAVAYTNDNVTDSGLVNGSLSVLHVPTGLSLTVAAAYNEQETRTPEFIYGKLGYQVNWFDFGKTYFSVDAYSGHDTYISGSRSQSYGRL